MCKEWKASQSHLEIIELNAALCELRKQLHSYLHWAHDGVFYSFGDIDGEIDDLIAYFEEELSLDTSSPEICSPEVDMTQVHISG